MKLAHSDLCRCLDPHSTGRRYFGNLACFCGGFMVGRVLAKQIANQESVRIKSEWFDGRKMPKFWMGRGA